MKLETQLRETIRMQGKSPKTADAYWLWVQKFLLFARQKRGEWVHPKDLRERQVEIWLKHLANYENVSAGTQNQAFSALCYLYRHVLKQPLENVSAFRAKRPDRVREVLDQSELVELFGQLRGQALLAARMMYASSFRIGEIGEIRIKDISFERRQITIRGGKGQKDRVVGFPEMLHQSVRQQIESAKVLWRADCQEGRNGVSLPNRFGIKSPSSHREFAWYYLFTSDHESRCPHTQKLYRHHQDMGHIARQIKLAAVRCGFAKRVTSHCLRHSFATHSLENGVPIHVVQALMGHTSIETTEGYIHITKDGATAAASPLQSLESQDTEHSGREQLVDALRNPAPRRESKPMLRVFAG
jgi:integron integrase